jgi:hypothetical protein
MSALCRRDSVAGLGPPSIRRVKAPGRAGPSQPAQRVDSLGLGVERRLQCLVDRRSVPWQEEVLASPLNSLRQEGGPSLRISSVRAGQVAWHVRTTTSGSVWATPTSGFVGRRVTDPTCPQARSRSPAGRPRAAFPQVSGPFPTTLRTPHDASSAACARPSDQRQQATNRPKRAPSGPKRVHWSQQPQRESLRRRSESLFTR